MSKSIQLSKCAVTLAALLPLMSITLQAGQVPFIASQPGLGKSSIVKQYANTHNLKFIDVRLAGYDPTFIDGFPMINKETKRAFFGQQESWPLASDELPLNYKLYEENLDIEFKKGSFSKDDYENKTDTFNKVNLQVRAKSKYDGWLILLDELPAAPPAVQAAAYRLILDKEVGQEKLHPKVQMVAAGNRIIDNAIAGKLGTALQSRVVHYEVKADFKAWKNWAINAGINPRVIAFADLRPEIITDFDPNHKDVTFACSRTIEFLSDQVDVIQKTNVMPLDSHDLVTLYAGTIGYARGMEFKTFMSVFGKVPTIQEILNDPANVRLPSEPDQKHAMAAMVGENLNLANASTLMIFLNRTPAESQVTALRTAIKREPALQNDPTVNSWIMNVAQKMRA